MASAPNKISIGLPSSSFPMFSITRAYVEIGWPSISACRTASVFVSLTVPPSAVRIVRGVADVLRRSATTGITYVLRGPESKSVQHFRPSTAIICLILPIVKTTLGTLRAGSQAIACQAAQRNDQAQRPEPESAGGAQGRDANHPQLANGKCGAAGAV